MTIILIFFFLFIFSLQGISERRMKKVNQLIKGIKQIKLNAWEGCFSSLVTKDRKKEMKKLYEIAYFKSLIGKKN